ncbi:hypothetical protein [Ktedonosporobacter rubrisoli]|nr:hypothetical protein [Ktedonosporobacter rubrisoli]
MQSFILLVVILILFVGAFGFMVYRNNVLRREQERRRNQYHDRV